MSCLSGSELEAARNLLAHLREYGIFIVSVGEVEMWLRYLGISGHASPLADSYVRMHWERSDAARLRSS